MVIQKISKKKFVKKVSKKLYKKNVKNVKNVKKSKRSGDQKKTKYRIKHKGGYHKLFDTSNGQPTTYYLYENHPLNIKDLIILQIIMVIVILH